MGYIKKLKNNELVGGTDKTTIYPVTSAEAVFEEVSDREFKSQKYLNNHITNERIVDNTIENDKLKDDTIDMGKLNTQLKTIIQNAYDASWKVKEEPFSLETKYDANDVVYDPDTNSSYVSLTADNQGNPVKLEDEEEVNPYWRLVINGISAVQATEEIEATKNELIDYIQENLKDQVDEKITDANARIEAAEQYAQGVISGAEQTARSISGIVYQTVAATPNYTDTIPVQNKAVTAQIGYYTCTGGSGATIIVDDTDAAAFTPVKGGHIKILMTEKSAVTSGNVQLQFGSIAATKKVLLYNGETVSTSNSWEEDEVISVFYDGTNYQAFDIRGDKKRLEKTEFVIAKRIIDDDARINALNESKLSAEELIKDEYVIAKALVKGIGGGGSGSGNSGILTIANSDIINVIGSSYTDGGHVLAGKNWVHRVSELSDYQYNNDGASGTSYDSQLSGDYRANSIRYKGYCLGKYVILNNNENDGLGATKSYADWFKTLDNIVRVCTGLGIEPILATNWTQSNNFSNISLMYENYASEHNLIYMNGNDYSKTLYDATQYGLWNAGTHLGTRNQGIFSDAYLPYLQRMERPVKSMKIFRLRAGYNTSNLDILMFTDNSDRLRYFREIWCGTKACSQDSVDNHPNVYPAAGDGCPNQYEILRNGGSVSFTNAALISAVIPYTGKNTTSLQFTANITGSVNVYVKDVLATPYPATTSYTRFNVAAEDAIDTVPQTGATYSDGTTVFTVHHVTMGENGSYCTIYMNGWTDGDVSGDLQKQSGVGSSTIHYTIREYYAESASMGDTCGHWIKIDKDGAKYNLTNIARRIMDYDKLNILIVGDSFTLSDPRVYYAGENPKALHRSKYTFVCNADNPNSEVIQEPSFGEVGTTLSSWKDDNGNALTSTSNYGAEHPIGGYVDLPNGLHSILVVNDVNAINTTIASDMTDVMLEIYARYFPPVYTDGSGNQITYESYDYEDLFIQFGNTGLFNSLIKKQVGVSWKIIQVPMKRIRAGKLRIYGGAKGVEIAKVSIKKIVNYEAY